MTINKVCVSGNLTRDCDLRKSASGLNVVNFCIANNKRKRNAQTGEWEDEPNYIYCVMFGKHAEKLANLLVKGVKVVVSGRLQYSSWEKDGVKRSKLDVIVENIEIMRKLEHHNVEDEPFYSDGGNVYQV